MRLAGILGTFIVVSVVATAFFASAASLTVAGGTLGAGNDSVASCDADGVNVSWATSFVQSLLAFEVTDVTVSGIDDAACEGGEMTVVLTNLAGTVIGTESTTIGAVTSAILDFSLLDVLASAVTNAYVVITGP